MVGRPPGEHAIANALDGWQVATGVLGGVAGGLLGDVVGGVADGDEVGGVTGGVLDGLSEGDGDSDVLITTNGGPAYLLRNDGGNKLPSVRLRLVGVKSNRSAIGARVVARVGTATLRRMVQSGTSYCSQPEFPITLGLAGQPEASSVEISWPSGGTTRLEHVKAGQTLTIREGAGIVAAAPSNSGSSRLASGGA